MDKSMLRLSDILEKYESKELCILIGGDSTNTNTGWRGGIHSHLEKMVSHKCFWSICMKHTNELKLRHLITTLDGPTSSRDGFTGPVGKLLSRVDDMPVNENFPPLPDGEPLISLTSTQIKQLTTDSYICYQYITAIKQGHLSSSLANHKCGKLCHSRWLTTGQVLLMLWTREHGLSGKPLQNLELRGSPYIMLSVIMGGGSGKR